MDVCFTCGPEGLDDDTGHVKHITGTAAGAKCFDHEQEATAPVVPTTSRTSLLHGLACTPHVVSGQNGPDASTHIERNHLPEHVHDLQRLVAARLTAKGVPVRRKSQPSPESTLYR